MYRTNFDVMTPFLDNLYNQNRSKICVYISCGLPINWIICTTKFEVNFVCILTVDYRVRLCGTTYEIVFGKHYNAAVYHFNLQTLPLGMPSWATFLVNMLFAPFKKIRRNTGTVTSCLQWKILSVSMYWLGALVFTMEDIASINVLTLCHCVYNGWYC